MKEKLNYGVIGLELLLFFILISKISFHSLICNETCEMLSIFNISEDKLMLQGSYPGKQRETSKINVLISVQWNDVDQWFNVML